MTTLIEAMERETQLTGNVHYSLKSEVVKVTPVESGFAVHLTNGHSVIVQDLILTLPQQPLLSILHASPLLTSKADKTGMQRMRALHRIRASPAIKLYILYEDAWWRNELNLTSGYFNNSAAPEKQTSGTAVPQFPPLAGRYHDGDVRCDPTCRGFLETTYAFDDVSIAFFKPYRAVGGRPVVLLGDKADDIAGHDLLKAVHEELLHLHKDDLAKVPGALERTRALRPSLGVLAIWDEAVSGFGGAIHDWMRDTRVDATCSSFEQCQWMMPPRLMQPLPPLRLFVAGEAFGARNGWTESALAMVENILSRHFGLNRPKWIDNKTYAEKVMYNISFQVPQKSALLV